MQKKAVIALELTNSLVNKIDYLIVSYSLYTYIVYTYICI